MYNKRAQREVTEDGRIIYTAEFTDRAIRAFRSRARGYSLRKTKKNGWVQSGHPKKKYAGRYRISLA